MTSPFPAIDARNLTLTLGEAGSAVDVLRGIDLIVPQGQTLALLGPSGSGKSSLMAVLTGLERATAGQLTVAGADFSAHELWTHLDGKLAHFKVPNHVVMMSEPLPRNAAGKFLKTALREMVEKGVLVPVSR